ncbi:MAG TPA: sulfatase-like hydrolase/transferase, partial [Candidatus Acidoferrum sp.]|nr:sulfatase-like hydrolase/transferase [Candidatus Acidoferrum sp.]
MEQQNFVRRVIFPAGLAVGVMIFSIFLYDGSRNISNPLLHTSLSHAGAVLMFASIWLGALWVNPIAFFRGASFGERVTVCLATPVIWCGKVLGDFLGIYSTGEFFFFFLHHFILGCPLVALLCMSISEAGCRFVARRRTREPKIKIFALQNTMLLAVSFGLVFFMLWNGGHTYYYLYMEAYARIFQDGENPSVQPRPRAEIPVAGNRENPREVLAAKTVFSGGGIPGHSDRPNIIFILSDDHRWDAMSGAGHPFLKTPNLDRLSSEGVHFRNAFVTTSLCSPSRASILTGQYAHTHGVVTNHTPWKESQTTFMEGLKTAGYETAFIGKWHMPGEELPRLRGLDRFVTFTKEGGQGVYYDCPLIIDGVETERPGKYITEDLTDLALSFIEQKRERPFFLYLAHKAVH